MRIIVGTTCVTDEVAGATVWDMVATQLPPTTHICLHATQGMRLLSDVQYVAIFDADFRPEPDFLLATVPYLLGDVSVAFVQARWVFANPEESFLTKVGPVELNLLHTVVPQATLLHTVVPQAILLHPVVPQAPLCTTCVCHDRMSHHQEASIFNHKMNGYNPLYIRACTSQYIQKQPSCNNSPGSARGSQFPLPL